MLGVIIERVRGVGVMLKNTIKKLSGSKKQKSGSNKKKRKKKVEEEEEFELDDEEMGESDEEFDEMGDFGGDLEQSFDDDLEGGGPSSGKFSEFDNRIKDMENEVGLVSSKLNTIRGENEEMGRRIQEIEENIRKLLGIYEMVTEGINPFATEVGFGADEGFGLFTGAKKSQAEEVPDELMSQDAESFFEDVDDDMGGDMDLESDLGTPDASNGEAPEDMFKRLKGDLNSGEADIPPNLQTPTDQVKEAVDAVKTTEDSVSMNEIMLEDEIPAQMQDLEPQLDDGLDTQSDSQIVVEPLEPQQENQYYETTQDSDIYPKEEREVLKQTPTRVAVKNNGPYLQYIRRDFVSDIIALKWMDYLVTTFGIKRMAEIIDFYVDVGWISKGVKELLVNYSRGYTLREMAIVEEGNTPTLRDHIKSLIFIAKLGGYELKVEEIEKVVKDIEELESEINDVIPSEHAIGSDC